MKQLFAIALFLGTVTGFAQPHLRGENEDRREKIEAIKAAYITEELELTVAESQAFWPVYNELQKKEIELREGQRSRLESLRNESSDKALEKAMYDMADGHIALEELRKSYIDDFIGVLGAKKTAQLFKAEREFGRKVMERLHRGDRPKDRGQKEGAPHPRGARPMR